SLRSQPPGKSFTCVSGEFKSVRKRYFETLNIPGTYLDRSYDRCFCKSCAEARRDGMFIETGDPPERVAVPDGCMMFGVKLSPQATNEDIFNKWHGCYHGTSPENIMKILKIGRLLKPGDVDPEGSQRTPGRGRFTEATAPRGHDVNQYFFTPSLKYTMYGNLYAAARSYEDHETGKTYYVRTILQVRVKPDSYKKDRQTMGASGEIDELFSNDEIEWSTNREGVHYIFGILVHMTTEEE
ncbi:Neuralized-like protein 4, partial [Geodia barretti]